MTWADFTPREVAEDLHLLVASLYSGCLNRRAAAKGAAMASLLAEVLNTVANMDGSGGAAAMRSAIDKLDRDFPRPSPTRKHPWSGESDASVQSIIGLLP